MTGPRLKSCPCQGATCGTFSPLMALFTEHVSPEMLYLETKWASLVPFGVTVELLKDVLPVGTTLNAQTVRNPGPIFVRASHRSGSCSTY